MSPISNCFICTFSGQVSVVFFITCIFNFFDSGGSNCVYSLLATFPRGTISLFEVLRGQLTCHHPAQRVLQPGLVRAILPQCGHKSYSVQHHV